MNIIKNEQKELPIFQKEMDTNTAIIFKLVISHCDLFDWLAFSSVCSDFNLLLDNDFWRTQYLEQTKKEPSKKEAMKKEATKKEPSYLEQFSKSVKNFEDDSSPNQNFWKLNFLKAQKDDYRSKLVVLQKFGYHVPDDFHSYSLIKLTITYQQEIFKIKKIEQQKRAKILVISFEILLGNDREFSLPENKRKFDYLQEQLKIPANNLTDLFQELVERCDQETDQLTDKEVIEKLNSERYAQLVRVFMGIPRN